MINIMKHTVHDKRDILMAGEKKQEGSRLMEQKVYKTMKSAGATNIAVGVITLGRYRLRNSVDYHRGKADCRKV